MHRAPTVDEQLRGEPPETEIGRALQELDIRWIAAHSPQAKGRTERSFGTLQDRLLKQLRLAGVSTLESAIRFLEEVFVPHWEERFTVAPRRPRDGHRRLGRKHRLEQILSVRVARNVVQDHTVSWGGHRWVVPREAVRAELRGARLEAVRRLDVSHWLRPGAATWRC